MVDIVARKQAKSEGLKRYFTGQPCKYGHVEERQTTNGGCIVCIRERDRQWQDANRELANAKSRAWQKNNPEKVRASKAKYNAKHRKPKQRSEREKAIAGNRVRYFTGLPCKYGHIAERFTRNRGCVTCYLLVNRSRVAYKTVMRRHRRAKERQADGTHTLADVKRILMRQGRRCAYCKTSLKGGHHVDHIVPLVNGGGNGPSNLQCLCPPCNLKKSAKSSEEYARSIGLLL